MRKIFFIYDTLTLKVWEWHKTELECVERYKTMFDGFINVDWIAIDVDDLFKSYLKVGIDNV